MGQFDDIIKRHRPRGYRVRHTRRKDKVADISRTRLQSGKELPPHEDLPFVGECWPDRKIIYAPRVVDAFTLHTLLHEFGHVHLGHFSNGYDNGGLTHQQEYECEQWAVNIMKIHGVSVPRFVWKGIRTYIRNCIYLDEQKGLPIRPHVRRFARM